MVPSRAMRPFVALVLLAGCASSLSRPVIALLTDYGTRDSYVAELKGAIYSIAHDARIADLTHEVPAFDIREGAYLLGRAARQFPSGTIFVCVVDPGVGTARKAIAVRSAKGKVYVGPDNGLFSRIYDDEGPCVVHELAERRFWRDPPSPTQGGEAPDRAGARGAVEPASRGSAEADPSTSTTFHGRDIFGPVAAHLSSGAAIESLGPRVAAPVRLSATAAARDGDAVVGEIVHVDVYGNCSTNIPASLLSEGVFDVNGRRFPRKATYADVPEGQPVLVIDSEGRVELALNMGSLGASSGWKAGTALRITSIK